MRGPVRPGGDLHRSDLRMILVYGLSEAEYHQQEAIVEALDFPPEYPGPPPEDPPPTYEQASNFKSHLSVS